MTGMPELKEIHLLLTYRCDSECDHCFVWSSPRTWATMTLDQVRDILDQVVGIGVPTVRFEGGEPFLFHPLLVAAVHHAHLRGLRVGVVTNGYWATSEEDAGLWLEPLAGRIENLSVSTDPYHGKEMEAAYARRAEAAARGMGIPVTVISIRGPGSGEGGTLFHRGRAAEKLVREAKTRPLEELGGCPENPPHIQRLHIDPYGNVLFCQGISIGNLGSQSLAQIVGSFEAERHPIIGPLMKGLRELARAGGYNYEGGWADACHLCYAIRSEMVTRRMYRLLLKPLQAYGIEGMD